MRHTKLFSDFAPPWVLLLFAFTVIEALVLAVYFQAHVPDAEMASMAPKIEATQQLDVTMHAHFACERSTQASTHGEACGHYH